MNIVVSCLLQCWVNSASYSLWVLKWMWRWIMVDGGGECIIDAGSLESDCVTVTVIFTLNQWVTHAVLTPYNSWSVAVPHPLMPRRALKLHEFKYKFSQCTWWGIITGPPSTKWQNFVTMLFFGLKILTTKHEIMLHAISLKGGSRTSTNCVHVSWQLGTNWISALLIRQSGSGAHVFLCAFKRKADTLKTNWVSSVECYCCL